MPYRTPLRGMYLGSSAAFPGGAVHGVPGDAAASAALADESVAARAPRAEAAPLNSSDQHVSSPGRTAASLAAMRRCSSSV